MPNRPRFTSRMRLLISSMFVGRISTPIARMLLALAVCAALFSQLAIFKLIPSVFADTTTPVSVATFGTALTQNFDTLVSAGTGTLAANTPVGWGFSENTANTSYTAGTGSGATGDTYSFGSVAVPGDRALGQLRSGTTISTLGATFQNNTGGTITSLAISYVGEQWRLGGTGRTTAERMDFQYSTNATSLTTGTWIDVNALDFNPPITSGPTGALDGNAPANRISLSSNISGLTISAGATFWIRWTDVDAAPGADDGVAVDDFSATATGFFPGETEPSVTVTSPINNAINVPVNTNIAVTFSESVTATPSAFSIQCPNGSPQTFSQTASPSTTFTLNPTADLPYSTVCTVTVTANQISDTDVSDPPDQMASDFVFSFTTANPPPPVATNVIINEVDADNPSTDTTEFVELYDGGVGNTSLTGLVVVFYNGSSDLSYASFDLDGFTTNANGYFTLGNAAAPGVDLVFPDNTLQNGADAVALYAANGSDFPSNTAVTTTSLQDAIVYDTDDADDAGLLVLLNSGQSQVNENGGGNGQGHSSQRCPNGTGGQRNTSTYTQNTPTPDGANNCVPPPPPSNSVIVISQLYGGGGNSGATYQNDYVELYNRGTTTVDIGGWSLQYASATGSGWDFSKQPLGGTIAPGEYLLISLASGGANGAPLPPANIYGQINMSGTSGKVALVNNFDGLVGNCPTSDPDVMDFVGYGSADCREGASTAPSPSNTTSIFRLGDGAVDTDNNGSDFVTGSPAPRRTAPIVELGPLVLSTDPRTNGTNAPRDATIQVTFTEPVDVVGAWFDITCANTGQHNSATFAGGGQTHYITPNVNFLAGEQCTVTIFKDQIHDQDLDDGGTNTDTLPANYVWSFTVSTGTAPPYPSSVHLTMGNPSGAIANTGQPFNYLMEKPEYSLSYHRDFGRPNWVSWHLSDEWVGTLTRVDTFRPDPAVDPSWYRVQSFDFSGSGFDRGHMVPNADRDKETSIPINQATFLMSNMLAQAPDNNQGPWASFENYLRTLLPGDEIYIVAGGVGTGGSGSNGGVTLTIANGNVTVPSQTWKVALVIPKASGDDISRVSCASRTIAIIMPNTQGIRNDPWENFLTNVDTVETLTGYDFFSNLPEPIQRCVEAGTNGNNPPLDTDADGDPDDVDNCPFVANPNQENFDNDTMGDACDADDDNDSFSDTDENTAGSDPFNSASTPEVCDGVDNDLNDGVDEGFTNTDGDSQADCVDADDDNDGFSDTVEAGAGSDPLNSASTPEVCDGVDNDLNDGVDEGFTNTDGDSQADCVDNDDDNDGVSDTAEIAAGSDPLNAASTPEVCDGVDNDLNDGIDEGFPNTDGDGQADCVDDDDDGDGVLDANDNCPLTFNPNQADFDLDGIGDVCDPAQGPPSNKDQCKNGGWQLFTVPRTFNNQGDCIQFVNTGH